jgi:replicative DNA helicase
MSYQNNDRGGNNKGRRGRHEPEPEGPEEGEIANLDAEAGVIGCCLQNNMVALECRGMGMAAEWFYSPQHQAVWQGIVAVLDASAEVDEISVGDALNALGMYEAAGGPAGLSYITGRVETTANSKFWVEIVRRCWMQRTASSAIRLMAEEMRKPCSDMEEVRTRCMAVSTKMGDLVSTAVKRGEKEVAKAAEVMMERLLSGERLWAEARMVGHGLDYLDNHPEYLKMASPVHDPLRKWAPTEVIVLAARPSVGKTTMAIQAAANALLRRGQCVVFDSLEMQMEEIVMRMAAVAAGVPLDDSLEFQAWKAESTENQHRVEVMRENMKQITALAGERFFFRGGATTLEEILMHARWSQQRCGQVHLVVVDYLQLVEPAEQNKNKSVNRQEVVATVTRSFKLLAMSLECVVLELSQINRDGDDPAGPKLTNMRESDAIGNDADRVYALWEPPKDANGSNIGPNRGQRPIMFRCLKHRRGPKDFDLPLNFSQKTKTFYGVPRAGQQGRPRKGMSAQESREALARERAEAEMNRGIKGFEQAEQVGFNDLGEVDEPF